MSAPITAILGLGVSGRSAAALALKMGHTVRAFDDRLDVEIPEGIERVFDVSAFKDVSLLVVSPGVPATHPLVEAARKSGIDVVGELGFAARFVSFPLIGITGTNGKSTVSSFAHRLLTEAGYNVFLGGNFGSPLSDAVISGASYDVGVVEVSSYQLEFAGAFAPEIAAITNLSPDHLARHGDLETYGKIKTRIARGLSPEMGVFVPSEPGLLTNALEYLPHTQWRVGGSEEVAVEGDWIRIELPKTQATFGTDEFGIPGSHNQLNLAFALALCTAFGADQRRLQRGIASLASLPHRMEVVGTNHGVRWINDSKGTNVAATLAGVSGLSGPGFLLLGGVGKGEPFAPLVEYLSDWRVITFGEWGPRIADELDKLGVFCVRAKTLNEGVVRARALARSGDTVLLSPGCASFDAFKNFEDRGNQFRDWVSEVES